MARGAEVLVIVALTIGICRSAPTAAPSESPTPVSGNSGIASSVGAQPAPVPAGSIPYLPADAEAQQRQLFPTTDFAYAFDNLDTSTPGGNLSGLFVNNNQVLATLPGAGVGQNLVTLAPCAINQPHVHPRGTEISHVTEGELFFAFIEENANSAGTVGGRFINATLTRGQTIIVPQGLIHYAQNLQCQTAQFIATFPTSDPGTQTVAASFFGKLPLFTLRATLGLDDDIINAIVSKVKSVTQANPSIDVQCLANCGLPIPASYFASSPSGQFPDGY